MSLIKIDPGRLTSITLKLFEEKIESHIEATARSVDPETGHQRYSSAQSCATYVASTRPKWAAEAQAFIAWRDDVWDYAFAELDKVLSGQREQPTVEELIAELPTIEWPE